MSPDGTLLRLKSRMAAPGDVAKAWGALLVVQLLFGALPAVSKFAIAQAPPQVLVLCRGFSAAFVFAVLVATARWRKQKSSLASETFRVPWGWRTHAELVGLAALGVAFNQTLLFYGLQKTTSAAAAILTPMISVFALFLSLILRREHFAWSKLANIALGMSGVLMLFAPYLGEAMKEDAILGNLMCLASTFSYASYLVLSPPLTKRLGSLEFSLAVFSYASVINIITFFALTGVSPWGLPQELLAALPGLSASFWWALGYLVLGATVVTYLLNAYALGILSPGIVGGLVCLQTIIGVTFSNLLLSEPFPKEHAIAMVLVVAGVLCLWIPAWRKRGRRGKNEAQRKTPVA